MWTSLRKTGDTTNKVVMPVAGAVSVTVPSGVEICAYVNDAKLASLEGMSVAAGDTVHFELMKESAEPSIVTVTYNGEAHSIHVEGIAYKKPKKAKKGDKKMDTSNLFAVPVSGAGTMGGAIGGGLGAGLLGGVLGGALLGNNGNGGLWAKGIWGMEDLIFDSETEELLIHGFGFYHETYEKQNGKWLFTSRQLKRTLVREKPEGSKA